jgi:cell division protein FtsX
MNTILLIVGILLGFLVALLKSVSTSKKSDATILDLTNKIQDKKNVEAIKAANSDAALKEYQNALKAYDPNFHSDDGSNKPSN